MWDTNAGAKIYAGKLNLSRLFKTFIKILYLGRTFCSRGDVGIKGQWALRINLNLFLCVVKHLVS